MALSNYFGLVAGKRFVDVDALDIGGSSSQRVLDVVLHVGAREYITGHGAARYLDHSMFDRAGVQVRYMRYRRQAYPQLHGEFTPYVSGLDLVANCGREGGRFICSDTIPWEQYLHESA
jgi:hypothetical protein